MTSTSSTATSAPSRSHDDYKPFLAAMQTHLKELGDGPYFETDVDRQALWLNWLAHLPKAERASHDCRACRYFVETYGHLVFVRPSGNLSPIAFPYTQPTGIYNDANLTVAAVVGTARITGVHVSSKEVWGVGETHDSKRNCVWSHMHIVPPPAAVWRGAILSAYERASLLREEHGMLMRGLAHLAQPHVLDKALALVDGDAFYRGEKIVERLRWLKGVSDDLAGVRQDRQRHARRNMISWLAVATAPKGFCHIKSSVIAPLLEDIAAGKSVEEIKRAHADKLDPAQYRRPTAPPSDGNIAQAERIVEQLGIAPAFKRRFARLEDLVPRWQPKPTASPTPGTGGMFTHLREPSSSRMVVQGGSSSVMTWEKFARTVLPGAEKISFKVPYTDWPYFALTAAADPHAPPILQWDRADARNSVSWYTYQRPTPAYRWGLNPGTLVDVNAVVDMPNQWQPGFAHHGDGVILVLAGCRDITGGDDAALFPEQLRGDLHSVRAVVSAYSARERLTGAAEASACGIHIGPNAGRAGRVAELVVTSRGTVLNYSIDRWD